MSFSFVFRSTFDMCHILLFVVFKDHVFLLLFFLRLSLPSSLNFNLVDDVKSAAIITLQVCSAKHEVLAILFNFFEEAVADVRDHILLLDLIKLLIDLLGESKAVLSPAHELLDLLEVVSGSGVLLLLGHVDSGAAVAQPHVLHEVGAVANRLTFQREDEGARASVEAVRAA